MKKKNEKVCCKHLDGSLVTPLSQGAPVLL